MLARSIAVAVIGGPSVLVHEASARTDADDYTGADDHTWPGDICHPYFMIRHTTDATARAPQWNRTASRDMSDGHMRKA